VSLAQRALDGILGGSPATVRGRARLKAAITARSALLRLGDPVVRYRLGGIELELPLSHELPFYRSDHPEYGEAVGRIAGRLGGPVVDIGANVGDTAAVVRAHTEAPVLCVEGDEVFFGLLERNAGRLGDVELERVFVSGLKPQTGGGLERARGTARIVAGEGAIRSRPLAEVLAAHPRFAAPALIKLDTDGMDVPILLANLDLLARLRPVLFFEYDPHLGAEPVVFERLREVGYERMHVYENTGEHVETVELPGAIHERYSGHSGARYADVCVLPAGTDVAP
jgi:FkbM family methyltransferase